MQKKVVVLFGGWNKERDVSIKSSHPTIKALKELGYNVSAVDLPKNLETLVSVLKTENPDRIFNCTHGTVGEDGTLQAILNYLKIPYTHSGMLASALAMDKWQSYNIFKAHNIPTLETYRIETNNPKTWPNLFPCIIKPVNEGSSVGIKVLHTTQEWKNYLDSWSYGQHAIVQPYLKCREIHVAILNNKAMGTIEIKPKNQEFFDYTSKYVPGELETFCPAVLPQEKIELALDVALRAYKALECRSLARVDMLFDDHSFYVLEVNTQPGFTPTSLAPRIADGIGMSFNDLVQQIVQEARCD